MFNFFDSIYPFGLDLSDLSLKIVQLTKRSNQAAIRSFGRFEIPQGVIENSEIKKENDLVEIIKRGLAGVKGPPLKTKNCICSLPESESFIQLIQLPAMSKEEMREAIHWEAEANFPLPLKELYFDWQQITPLRDHEQKAEILVGALKRNLVETYLKIFKLAGIEPLVFEVESVATCRALIKDDFSAQPVLIIDLGAKKTSLIIFSGRTVHLTTSLSLSNTSLIEEIAKNLNISFTQAKGLKFGIGLDPFKDKGRIFGILKPKIEELAKKIQDYLNYFQEHSLKRHYFDSKISVIYLCGGGALLYGLSDLLSFYLKIPVKLGKTLVNVSEQPSFLKNDSLAYTTALGLALRGLKEKI